VDEHQVPDRGVGLAHRHHADVDVAAASLHVLVDALREFRLRLAPPLAPDLRREDASRRERV
jgi:hypothetical protein